MQACAHWAPFRSTKGAIKLHTLLDLRGAIPACIHISDGKLHEVNVLDLLPVEAGAFYVMDRGYLDYKRLYAIHQAGAFFFTRANQGMHARRVYSAPTDRPGGVICDQRVMLNGFYAAKDYPEHLRRIRFKDPASGKAFVQAEIGSIDRFRSSHALAAYAGLVPTTRSSGGKTAHGGFGKASNRWLTWILVVIVVTLKLAPGPASP